MMFLTQNELQKLNTTFEGFIYATGGRILKRFATYFIMVFLTGF